MIGARIRHIRMAKGMTLAELSNKTGLAKAYLTIIETNLHSNPTNEYIEKIANALEVELGVLLVDISKISDEAENIADQFAEIRQCVIKMTDLQLEEMKDFIEFIIWRRAKEDKRLKQC
ncbi:helix-turn-helix transcriptional regulator [Bacillus sp. FJAT-50079]|uniref:helix-turn-helix domain-containing protein n=1 Tax=Bacillus sp. FJAT-50079 TaxID=2833577 RepID=UPI001BC93058|nr:helix-turn-helix transcriptional regulator [Bacillus sp. FJAT-50079]MBS4210684.1 helix-turn-helix transcriptional regulator [Bacillus sp. FJAT-50079]